MGSNRLKAGASSVNITPETPCFLFGYPFVERISTGVNDRLLSSALYVTDGKEQVLFISNDIIYIAKDSASRIREAISRKTGIPGKGIMIAATHTHSGPVTVNCADSANDPVVPLVDEGYLDYMEERSVEAACQAYLKAEPVEIGLVKGDATGVGTNRHDPGGASDMEVPMMLVRNRDGEFIAGLLVCSMHPTVLHEDSTLFSGDFPHYVRESLQGHLGSQCTFVYCTGAAGNQSPRHVTRGNTFAEAKRLGEIVAGSLLSKIPGAATYVPEATLLSAQTSIDLPKRSFPGEAWATRNRDRAREWFETSRKEGRDPRETRTAEVDWFGAEELLFFSTLAASGSIGDYYEKCLPAEIQAIKIGEWTFVAWPGEIFVEYGLALKQRVENSFLITCANGELQGYIVTREADERRSYEAGNSLFHYTAGEIMSRETVELLNEWEV